MLVSQEIVFSQFVPLYLRKIDAVSRWLIVPGIIVLLFLSGIMPLGFHFLRKDFQLAWGLPLHDLPHAHVSAQKVKIVVAYIFATFRSERRAPPL